MTIEQDILRNIKFTGNHDDCYTRNTVLQAISNNSVAGMDTEEVNQVVEKTLLDIGAEQGYTVLALSSCQSIAELSYVIPLNVGAFPNHPVKDH